MKPKYSLFLFIGNAIACSALLSACSSATPTPTALPTIPNTVTVIATAQPTQIPAQKPVTQPPTVMPATVINVATPIRSPTTVSSQPVAPAITKLNLNTATGDDYLKNIPGFGRNMVREFLEYRPYSSILQFRKEIGKYVDQKQVAEYEKYVFVPIDINKADAATLQQIPGLDANEAADMITARPYANVDAFNARLSAKVNTQEMAIAQTYLVK
jgi:DNA uptake protein ComE-like DNA-binding protein